MNTFNKTNELPLLLLFSSSPLITALIAHKSVFLTQYFQFLEPPGTTIYKFLQKPLIIPAEKKLPVFIYDFNTFFDIKAGIVLFCDLVPLKGSGRCTSILTQWAFSAIASRGAHYFDQKPLLLIKHKMHVLCAGVLLLSEPHRRQFSGSDHSRVASGWILCLTGLHTYTRSAAMYIQQAHSHTQRFTTKAETKPPFLIYTHTHSLEDKIYTQQQQHYF